MTHEDDRRIIYDWANGNFKSAKALVAKQDCIVGNHLHRNKDEEFFLLSGRMNEAVVGNTILFNIEAPHYFNVRRGMYHKFSLEAGSILLGTATELFDEKDEIKVWE